jgi:Ankyrin repeats (3 copies)
MIGRQRTTSYIGNFSPWLHKAQNRPGKFSQPSELAHYFPCHREVAPGKINLAVQAADGPREGNVPPAIQINRRSSDPFGPKMRTPGHHSKEVVMLTPNSPIRPIPAHPNLEIDRKQAKALLDAAQHGDMEALRRFNAHHPRFGAVRDPVLLGRAVALHDAQLVVAREYGFASWPRWKQFVEMRRLDRAQRATELVKAACSNDVRKARVLLEAEPDLASFDLYTACACGEAEAVERFLVRDPALVNIKGGALNHKPILYACYSRFLRADATRRDGIVRVAKLLLDRGADPNVFYIMDGGNEQWVQSTLYAAGGIANNLELLMLLLDAGARVDALDKEVLYHTIEFPDPSCLRLLLDRGNLPAEQIKYCLGRATDFEYPQQVAMLLAAGADPNCRVRWDGLRTHLHKAVYVARSVQIVRLLIDAGGDVHAVDEYGVSILRSAVRNGDPEVVNLLRSHGAHDEKITEADARIGDPMTLCIAATRGDVATIDRVLDGGVDVNGAWASGQMPPLHSAAWHGRLNAVRKLVERGADIHSVNRYGGDALGTTVHGSANCFDADGGPGMRLPEEAFGGEYPEIVEYLVAQGAKLPNQITGGSDAVQEILRRHGVSDAE